MRAGPALCRGRPPPLHTAKPGRSYTPRLLSAALPRCPPMRRLLKLSTQGRRSSMRDPCLPLLPGVSVPLLSRGSTVCAVDAAPLLLLLPLALLCSMPLPSLARDGLAPTGAGSWP